MFTGNLVDTMNVLRPVLPADVTPPAVADDFAHLATDVQGDEEGEDPTLEDQRCRLFEKSQNRLQDGKQVVIITQIVYCEVCDVKAWDRLEVTPKGESERNFKVLFVKKIGGSCGIEGYALTVKEID